MSNSTAQVADSVDHDIRSSGERPRFRGVPRRRRWWLVLGASGLVAAAVVGNVALVASVTQRQPVLQLTRDVAWGQRIAPDDLTAVSLPVEAARYGVDDFQRTRVIGAVAVTNLKAGNLITRTDVTAQAVPAGGQQVVGIRLKPGQFPDRGLRANDPVQVIPLTHQSGVDSGTDGVPDGVGFSARIVQVSAPDSSGAVVADVLVAEDEAEMAIRASASGAVVALLGPER